MRYIQVCLDNRGYILDTDLVQNSQLVENEELIGTLLDTNERVIAALETYDKVSSGLYFTVKVTHEIAAL